VYDKKIRKKRMITFTMYIYTYHVYLYIYILHDHGNPEQELERHLPGQDSALQWLWKITPSPLFRWCNHPGSPIAILASEA